MKKQDPVDQAGAVAAAVLVLITVFALGVGAFTSRDWFLYTVVLLPVALMLPGAFGMLLSLIRPQKNNNTDRRKDRNG